MILVLKPRYFTKKKLLYTGDDLCDTAPYNTKECGYDGGDCKTFPVNCNVMDTYAIGDGVCHVEFNTTDCEYDGGDCLF